MILIVTSRNDRTAGAVIEALADLGRSDTFRLDLDEAHADHALTWSADGGGIRWSLRSRQDPSCVVSSENLTAIYWRRVSYVSDLRMMSVPASADLDASEVFWSLKWLLESLPSCYFPFGHPQAHATADNKHLQVAAALKVGFAIPESFHSNDPGDLRTFVSSRSELAVKALRVSAVTSTGDIADARHIACKAFPTARLLQALDGAPSTQLFCQQAIRRPHDLRIMVFPNETIAAAIDTSRLPDNKLDWREDSLQVAHRIVPVDPAFDRQLRAYLSEMGLTAGFFDFAEPEAGPPVFFECNTNAEWYWIEWLTKHPIARAVARELAAASDRHRTAGSIAQPPDPGRI